MPKQLGNDASCSKNRSSGAGASYEAQAHEALKPKQLSNNAYDAYEAQKPKEISNDTKDNYLNNSATMPIA